MAAVMSGENMTLTPAVTAALASPSSSARCAKCVVTYNEDPLIAYLAFSAHCGGCWQPRFQIANTSGEPTTCCYQRKL